MRFSVTVALLVVGLSMSGFAQKVRKPRAKAVHSEERDSNQKSAPIGKETNSRTSAASELRRVEQSSAKVSGSRRNDSARAARTNPGLKAQKKDGNAPIHFASTGGSGKPNAKSGDALKGRLRHKGRR
jgi:hypothetical protein